MCPESVGGMPMGQCRKDTDGWNALPGKKNQSWHATCFSYQAGKHSFISSLSSSKTRLPFGGLALSRPRGSNMVKRNRTAGERPGQEKGIRRGPRFSGSRTGSAEGPLYGCTLPPVPYMQMTPIFPSTHPYMANWSISGSDTNWPTALHIPAAGTH